jgi:hypothetical protein
LGAHTLHVPPALGLTLRGVLFLRFHSVGPIKLCRFPFSRVVDPDQVSGSGSRRTKITTKNEKN